MQRCALIFALVLGAGTAAAVDFDRDVRPILSENCYACHGPDDGQRKTAWRLDRKPEALGPLASGGRAIAPGDPDASVLLERVESEDPVRRMPPAYLGHAALSEAEIATLRQWIADGAAWSEHWAFIPPRRPAPPAVSLQGWARNPIDRFILARLEAAGLQPSPEADRRTLLRRLSLDLTGLPPTPEEAAAFASAAAPGAYEAQVERLLASPRYGERMAVPWLDAARYADTNGYQTDGVRSMWRWRDWVIDAFNRNMPFDAFTIEQIAGDLLPDPSLDQVIATAFHRNHRTSAEGGIVEEEFLTEYAADRVETTGTVWLGLTVGCARCHDHKFDPVSQKDFYRLFSYFNNLPERGLVYNFGNDRPMIAAPTPEQRRRTAELEAAAEAARRAWRALEPRVRAQQAAWEQAGLRQSGRSEPGLLAHFPLDGRLRVEARRGIDDADEGRRPRSAEAAYDEGVFGRGAQLDGALYLDGGSLAGVQYDDRFTISLWINPATADGGIVSRMQDHEAGAGWGLLLRDGRLRFEFTMRHTDHSMRVETTRRLEPGRWRHVAVVYGGEIPSHESLEIYVDGERWPFDVEWDDLKWPIVYKDYPLRIGAAAGRRFTGSIDELRIYGRAFDADAVAALAEARPIEELAALPAAKRSAAQALKLRDAFLLSTDEAAILAARRRLADAEEALARHRKNIPTLMVMQEGPPRQAHVLRRGAYDQPGEAVEPGTPAFLPAPADAEPNRLGLARWIVSRENPLTARVFVNRLWQTVFGVGLVKTAEDFGAQGERPSHPELLDWLAVELMDSGWDIQHMLRLMTTSATYRQSSAAPPELLSRDPENRLLARGARYRLPAEMIRDQALAVSGLLVERRGGPPVKPYQPPGLWEEVSGRRYEPDAGEGLYRRSLYTYWKRTVAPPGMTGFDAPDREFCTVRRARTNTPLQALTLMNDITYVEAAEELAERMLAASGRDPEARIARGFELVLARPPDAAEAATLLRAFGQLERDHPAPYAAVASLILNLDETVTRE